MEAQSKRLWIVTLANIAVAGLLLLVIYSVMLALAVLAEFSAWPLYLLLAIGIALSITGLVFAKAVTSRVSRRITFVVNGCALAFDFLLIIGLATLFFSSRRERFLIPDGYKGDIYVVYNAPDGEPQNRHGAITYRIPKEGILRVQGPMIRGWTWTEYYYQLDTGKVDHIANFWPSTIHPTQENLANDKDVGVYFPRSGSSTDSTGCSSEYEQFYVGTKAHLLTQYKEKDISAYFREHPACASHQK